MTWPQKFYLKMKTSFTKNTFARISHPISQGINEKTFLQQFQNKDLLELASGLRFLKQSIGNVIFKGSNSATGLSQILYKSTAKIFKDEIPMPINTGAFAALKKARELLAPDNLGYTGFDYGMLDLKDLNQEGRPYFNLYGGQYTFMVNFPLLQEVGREIGFSEVNREYQNDFVKRSLDAEVSGVVDLVQNHPQVAQYAWLGSGYFNASYLAGFKCRISQSLLGKT